MNKRFVVDQLKLFRLTAEQDVNFEFRDFEHDYVGPRFKNELSVFLDADEYTQQKVWREAWQQLLEEFPPTGTQDVILALHGVLVREIYGLRSLAYLEDIRSFGLTHLITLIDDVYIQWQETQDRAGELEYKGVPTLGQLLSGRRAELLMGDVISRNVEGEQSPLTNWVVPVRHPVRVLNRMIFGSEDLVSLYLSFPISEPRRLQEEGNNSGIEAVNRFLRAALERERENAHLVCFCPLSFDELPLVGAWKRDEEDEDAEIDFSLADRWDVSDYCGSDLLMASEPPSSITLKNREIENALGLLRGDVALLDYRLVKQVSKLLVFNPWFNGKKSKGAVSEIDYAIELRRPVHIYQDPIHDPEDKARNQLKGDAGALGGRPGKHWVKFHDSLDDVLSAAAAKS